MYISASKKRVLVEVLETGMDPGLHRHQGEAWHSLHCFLESLSIFVTARAASALGIRMNG